MKKTLKLAVLVLSCCLAAAAQTGSTPNQSAPASTPSTFPQDQTGQTQSNPAIPDSSAQPADPSAAGQVTSIQGCLGQSADGSFTVADSSGNNFQLRGDTSQLSGNLGKEVRLDGIVMPDSGSKAGAMSSGTSRAATQFSVSTVHKVADTCTAGSGTNQ